MAGKYELQHEITVLEGRKAEKGAELTATLKEVNAAKSDLRDVRMDIELVKREGESHRATADEHEKRRKDNEAILAYQEETIQNNRILLANHADRRDSLVSEIDGYEATKGDREYAESARIAHLFSTESAQLAEVKKQRAEGQLGVDALIDRSDTLTRDIEARTVADNAREAQVNIRIADKEKKLATMEARYEEVATALPAIEEAKDKAEDARDIAEQDVKELDGKAKGLRVEIGGLETRHKAILHLLGDAVEEQRLKERHIKVMSAKEAEIATRERWVRRMFKKLGFKYR